MHVGVRMIFRKDLQEIVVSRAALMMRVLGIDRPPQTSPYWKDEHCLLWELAATIEEPDFVAIQSAVEEIAARPASLVLKDPGSWECVCGAMADDEAVFVSCSIWE